MALADILFDPCVKAQTGVRGTLGIIKTCDVATVPAATAGVISTDITPESGKSFNDIKDYDEATAQIQFTRTFGKKYITTVTLFIPGLSATRKINAGEMSDDPMTMVIPDVNGLPHLVGDENTGIEFDLDGGTKTEDDEGNAGITFTGTWEHYNPLYQYDGAF